ncbi:hypothetical protein [Clostridium beijerinckii]|uniref:Uncharacterized protein n=1 Tax=Clostridium beijerinckii TaxID=1520 RepID=A0AAW3W989_CLOBE|nr:hypothetical protein [Clostridium beijerinckii]MBC2458158.1 hypothetical protein [Clostridium beijerinckii]MBC2475357.1 hypothetical protein [Clostridium beijerinckii]NOV62575.1 hypothetical protein [Clostridium beijerinckii]NOV70464.1 hypothetical protein [Clostridium beijerinckii]NOW30627.1 hypothetical protein [Clostridium beijerinckii]
MDKEYIRVTFEELGVVACRANNKRKMKSPIFDKLRLEMIPVFYEKWGYVFRSATDPKKYYSMEQLQELFQNYVENIQ